MEWILLLERENAVIADLLGRLQHEARSAIDKGSLSRERILHMLSGLGRLNDEIHYPKEDGIVLPAMASIGRPALAREALRLVREHACERLLRVELLHWAEERRLREFALMSGDYLNTLRDLLNEERSHLFPLLHLLLEEGRLEHVGRKIEMAGPRVESPAHGRQPLAPPLRSASWRLDLLHLSPTGPEPHRRSPKGSLGKAE